MKEYRKAGVIGYPISHSLSPRIHNYWLQQYHIKASYEAIPVKPEDLKTFLGKMAKEEFAGVNVTIPHKEAAFNLVKTDRHTQNIGAVNTIIVRDEQIIGMNTDVYGFIHSLLEKFEDKELKAISRKTLIMGAGGATRAVCTALQPYSGEITIVNRTREKAEKLASHMRAMEMENIAVSDWHNLENIMSDATLLVNTTSLGMKGQPSLDISLKTLPATAVVCDIVYNPLPTQLLKQAEARGNRTIDGLGMLLYQAQSAFAEWFDVVPEVTPELRHYVAEALL